MRAGEQLKELRNRLGITTREVEDYSRKIAESENNEEYYVSSAWLTQIENKISIPSIYKLYSLGVIYRIKFSDMLMVYGVDLGKIQSLVDKPIEFYSCFICHSHKDKEFCDRLYAHLRAKDVRCWYFPEDAIPGKRIQGEISLAIQDYDKAIVVCSRNSLNSGPVIDEIERAAQREDRDRKEILFPIAIDDYLFGEWDNREWEIAFKSRLLAKVVGNFREAEKYQDNVDKLLKALNRN